MKKTLVIIGVLFLTFICGLYYVQAQDIIESSGQVSIPKELPKPKSQEWIDNLKAVLQLEKSYKFQYEQDSQKFKVNNPYAMVIPQENNHIERIEELLTAYGLSTLVKNPFSEEFDNINAALEYAKKVESDLILRYEWLIKNAEDETARTVLNTILLQTRMNNAMFSHALWINEANM